jgi:hypothetical protein
MGQDTCPAPPDVGDRIGRAQIFSYSIADQNLLVGRRDVLWGARGNPLPGVYGMRYMPADRYPTRTPGLDWFIQEHPDWIVRKCDRQPAFEFGDPNVPVDIANPAVRAELFDKGAAPAFAQGVSAIALDNVEADNVWKRCGVERNGSWHQLYTGKEVDPSFTHDVSDWLGWLAGRLHEHDVCLAGNNYYHGFDKAGYLDVTAKLDMVVDEAGFTRHCKPLFLGATWLDRITLFRDIARSKPLVTIDEVCPTQEGITPQVVDWSLANQLLLKGDRSYLAMTVENGYGSFIDFPELYLKIGRPLGDFGEKGGIYSRRFERAIALLNPSPTASAQFDLRSTGPWLDHRTRRPVSDIQRLAPGTALVLIKPGA